METDGACSFKCRRFLFVKMKIYLVICSGLCYNTMDYTHI